MKAVLQDMKSGALKLAEVPPPTLQSGGVLVRVRRSLISLGTERAIAALARKGPIGKARDRPDLVHKVMNRARQEGLVDTIKVVRNLVSSPIPLGYSCAGEVVEVGTGASAFRPGDRVACAGLGFANHAEMVYVPKNLCVPVPAGVSDDDAAFVTIGAIALHGVRLAEIGLDDVVAVIGLGLVGQVGLRLAAAAGARTVAFDPDPAKTSLALAAGATAALSSARDFLSAVRAATGGHGADVVLMCAASKSTGPMKLAGEAARLRGRVSVIGDVNMAIERRAYFEKELSVVVSRSYGPGRYDPAYEVRGVDYPYGFVRWTERRNLSAVVELIGRGRLRVDDLVTHRYPIHRAEEAYELVTGKRREPAIAILLEYDESRPMSSTVMIRPAVAQPRPGGIRLGVIGAGQFAKGILLPAFAKHREVRFEAICTASGLTARHVAERYGARLCTSDPDAIIADDAIDAVVIATRHDQHARLAGQALAAGKAVFLEKPLATTEDDLTALVRQAADTEPRLMVGFNRRYAPLTEQCRAFFDPRSGPLYLNYRVNAGRVPRDSWVIDPVAGGGRLVGEGCHFIDFAAAITGALPTRVHAQGIGLDEATGEWDALMLALSLGDGSTAVIHYLTNGDTSVRKETARSRAELERQYSTTFAPLTFTTAIAGDAPGSGTRPRGTPKRWRRSSPRWPGVSRCRYPSRWRWQ